ncbi:MAG: sigma-E factor negative regulatory protein RseC [Pseudohongiellaceae bacterium]|jgi:sigma-E factor negative regulatory protein RseC
MLTEVGRVVAVESDGLWVETVQKSTCNSCSAQKGCGYGLLNETAHQRRNQLKVTADQAPEGGFKVNDVVQLELPEHLLVRGALMVYLLPLVVMLACATVSTLFFVVEGYIVLAAAAGLLAGFVGVADLSRRAQAGVQARAVLSPVAEALEQCIQVP